MAARQLQLCLAVCVVLCMCSSSVMCVDMSARWGHAAVHVPGHGLVVFGYGVACVLVLGPVLVQV